MSRVVYCFLFCCVMMCCQNINAQQSKLHVIQGDVYDALQQKGLDSVEVQLLSRDSSLLSSTDTKYDNDTHGRYVISGVKPGKYLLRFRITGFRDEYVKISVYRDENTLYRIKNVMMHRQINAMHKKDIVLGEAKVKASLIKMVYDKDTVVYNALAFKLAEGTMLDGLIKQLPGAEYKDGRILVNGEMVQSLLVNGKDFFKGDPSVALENLPAYMVSRIKVFKREREEDKVPNLTVAEEDKELVMDVRLKKEFCTGWVANAQGGYGTHNRYLARLFGLMFTKNSRFSVYGNANNINDNKVPGESGDVNRDYVYDGLVSRKKGGLLWGYEDKKNNMNLSVEAHVQHKDNDNVSKESGVRFFQQDVWIRSMNRWTLNENNYNVSGEMTWHPNFWNKISFFKFTPKVNYQRTRTNLQSYSLQLRNDPMEQYRGAVIDSVFLYGGCSQTKDAIINTVKDLSLIKNNKFGTSGYWYASPGFPIGKFMIKWDGNYSYGKNNGKTYSVYDMKNSQDDADNIFHDSYTDKQAKNYSYDINTHLQYFTRKINAKVIYTYKQEYLNNDRERYLLESLPDWSQGNKPLGVLPSSREELMSCLDRVNSYYSTVMKFSNKINFSVDYNWSTRKEDGNSCNYRLQVQLPLRLQTDRLNYTRDLILIKGKERFGRFLEPKIDFSINGTFVVNYSLAYSSPDMIYMLPTYDDYDPMNVKVGNEHLRDVRYHQIQVKKDWYQWKNNSRTSLNVAWNLTDRAIGVYRTYNAKTGVTTSKPINVCGNWNINSSFYTTLPVDKQKKLFLTNSTRVVYSNSVDVFNGAESVMQKSSVRSFNVAQELRASYRLGKYSFGGKIGMTWLNAYSKRENFKTINCANWLLGGDVTITLPWNMSFSSDLGTTLRTGYDDSNMNKATFICNARLTRRFYNGKLTIILDAFDIFGGLKNIQYYINEQGRREIWYNTLGRYVMVHAFCKFGKKPKKK